MAPRCVRRDAVGLLTATPGICGLGIRDQAGSTGCGGPFPVGGMGNSSVQILLALTLVGLAVGPTVAGEDDGELLRRLSRPERGGFEEALGP